MDTAPTVTHNSDIYYRPQRYSSVWQKVWANAVPLGRGAVRFGPAKQRKVTSGRLNRLAGRLKLRVNGSATIGSRCAFWGDPIAINLFIDDGAELTIGDNVFINYGVDIGCYHRIKIGSNVLIGPLTSILDDPLHEVEPGRPWRPLAITIEDNVWIGRQVIIQPGVTVGRNSVIAAGSVVTKNVTESSLVAGNPAVEIKPLAIPIGWTRR